MKRIWKPWLSVCLAFFLVFGFGACAANGLAKSGRAPMGAEDYYGGFAADGMAEAAMAGKAEGYAGEAEPEENKSETVVRPAAGQITAGAQDDNRYYAQWLKLFAAAEPSPVDEQTAENAETSEVAKAAGKFYRYLSNPWGMDSQRRVTVTVRSGGAPVAGAKVVCRNGDETAFRAVTNANGVAYLFPDCESGTLTVESGSNTATAAFDGENRDVTVELGGSVEKADVIELMFVVDVTGSMGDEISYLKSELADVVRQVASANAGAKINLAFLFYRDAEDSVPFKYVDFKDVTVKKNLTAQLKELDKQKADGGGDYPEAVDEALEQAVSKQWSANATKLIFLVLDAPPHDGQQYQTRFANAVRSAVEQGIRVCPVLASGADLLCEYTTRSAALLTGGTFVFVTDDSGIGGSHYDPDLPNVTVEYLNACMVRLINGYHTGTFADPVAWRGQ